MIGLMMSACSKGFLGKLDVKGDFIQNGANVASPGRISRVQASKLWYEKLREILHIQGYEYCKVDPCVIECDKVHLMMLHVEEIFLVVEKGELEQLCEVSITEYQ
jgi:hypothetical protein